MGRKSEESIFAGVSAYVIKTQFGENVLLNYLWAFMIIIGILFGAFNGRMPDITTAALDSSREAVTLCVTMTGVMSFWMGLMEVAAQAGILQAASGRLRPLIHFLFPNIPTDHKVNEYITTNFIANFLGLGWAATPAGLKAMEELGKLEEERRRGRLFHRACAPDTASNEMCNFLILNISSLQLIPVNVIAYRSQYGSVNPAAIVGAGILATGINTLAGILYCKIQDRRSEKAKNMI